MYAYKRLLHFLRDPKCRNVKQQYITNDHLCSSKTSNINRIDHFSGKKLCWKNVRVVNEIETTREKRSPSTIHRSACEQTSLTEL